jgi:hypothetical protein
MRGIGDGWWMPRMWALMEILLLDSGNKSTDMQVNLHK